MEKKELIGAAADLYIRVSTTEQAEEGYSIGEQEARLRAYCDAYGFVIHAVHIDPGFSGSNLDRPGIKAVIRDVKAGRCQKVIVWKLDRLSRSQKDTMMLLEDVFIANGCDFVSLMESFDTSTPFGRCIVGILAAFAQMERENIKARMMMGKAAGIKAGNYYGHSAPLGYQFGVDDSGRKTLMRDPYWGQMIEELFQRVDAGETIMSIGATLHEKYGWDTPAGNVPIKAKYRRATALGHLLRMPVYCGVVSCGEEHVGIGRHEPLVSKDVWDRVNAKLKERGQARARRGSLGLLVGIIYCPKCGARMCAVRWYKDKPPIYVCHSVRGGNPAMIRDVNCDNRKWKYYTVDELDNIVLDEIRKLALDRSAFDEIVEDDRTDSTDVDAFRDRIDELSKQITRLIDLCQSGIADVAEVRDRITRLSAERDAVSDSLDRLEDEAAAPDAEKAWQEIASLDAVIDSGDRDALQSLVRSLIDRVEVYRGDVTIHWAFSPTANR
ncbi:MAG: recombinase family protein [Clostridia bacterium]|nr:recombinase family protein [Clostridia bacterium]